MRSLKQTSTTKGRSSRHCRPTIRFFLTCVLTVIALLFGTVTAEGQTASTASNTLLATGFTLPYGAQVLAGSAINPATGKPFRHLWTADAGGQPGPWGVSTDRGPMLNASFGRVSAAPRFGTREVWTLQNGGGGWDHPIHIHFEEGQILARNGSAANVPAWEQGRKDVYRLRPGGSVTLTMQFRDWGGMFMEHCHNTVHEDNAMLVRWEIDDGGSPFLRPLPTPIATPQGVTFVAPDDIAPTAF